MKHGKHSKKRVQKANEVESQLVIEDISSRSEDIMSRSPKGRKVLNVFAKILFVLEMAALVALILYLTAISILPMVWILVLVGLLGILAGVHMYLLRGKIRRRRFKRKRIISLAMSIVMILVSTFGFAYLGVFNDFVGDIAMGDEENEDKVDNISKEPFIVYLSGVDTRNSEEIKDKALSDVNMIIAVNPKTKKVLMLSTPRDYYVAIEGDQNRMDKLTHAGGKGIECSMKTLEALYGVKFNYYARVNFKSVCDIVDAVGGITVVSDYNFKSRYGLNSWTWHSYTKGENHLDGDAALAFARERKAFANGDRQRGIHQQKVIEAVVKKAIAPSVLTNPAKVEDLLTAISKNTKTNFSSKEIKKLVSYQLTSMKQPWDFESMSVDGRGGKAYTASYPSQLLYVMYPDTETVEEAKAALQAVIKGEEIVKDTASDVSSN